MKNKKLNRRHFLYSLTGVFSLLAIPPIINSALRKVTDPAQLAIEKIKHFLQSTTNEELVAKIKTEFENEEVKELNNWILSKTEAKILSEDKDFK